MVCEGVRNGEWTRQEEDMQGKEFFGVEGAKKKEIEIGTVLSYLDNERFLINRRIAIQTLIPTYSPLSPILKVRM